MGLAKRLHRRESLLLPSSNLFYNTHDGISASTLLSSTCKGLWLTFTYYCLNLAIPTSVLKLPFICEVLRYSLKFKRHGATPASPPFFSSLLQKFHYFLLSCDNLNFCFKLSMPPSMQDGFLSPPNAIWLVLPTTVGLYFPDWFSRLPYDSPKPM